MAAGLLISDGERVRPSHPLLAVAARRHSRTPERQALHLALAGVAGDETLRARHLALSAPAQDAEVAGIVTAAATSAARRGAAHDAAELAEHALRLTPPSARERPGRLLALAQCLVKLGELSRVTELLGPRIDELPAGEPRARAHLLLGEDADVSGHEAHLERALANSGNDPALHGRPRWRRSRWPLLAVVEVELDRRSRSAGGRGTPARSIRRSRRSRGMRSSHWPGPASCVATRSGSWPGALWGQWEIPASMRSQPTAPRRSSLPSVAASARRGRRCARLLALADERGETRFGTVPDPPPVRAGTAEPETCRNRRGCFDEAGPKRLRAMEGMTTAHARCQALLASLGGRPNEVERWAAAAAVAPSSHWRPLGQVGRGFWRCCGRRGSLHCSPMSPSRAAALPSAQSLGAHRA